MTLTQRVILFVLFMAMLITIGVRAPLAHADGKGGPNCPPGGGLCKP